MRCTPALAVQRGHGVYDHEGVHGDGLQADLHSGKEPRLMRNTREFTERLAEMADMCDQTRDLIDAE
jgi:hypothetical protein